METPDGLPVSALFFCGKCVKIEMVNQVRKSEEQSFFLFAYLFYFYGKDEKVMVNYHYDGFLSYRHLPKDKKIAIRLQQLLEKHKRSDGHALCIFRDQSEFSASSDLGADIRRALEESRYLVIICTPAFKDSKWCMQEVAYFRQLHGESNRNILTLLVEGEPEESIPEQLRWESNENTATMVEPLCADIRAMNEHNMLRYLRTEYLRIAAPLLECSFDELYQRAQRQKRRRGWMIATAVTISSMAFAFYSMYMLNRISQKQQELYTNESRRLSALSSQQCESEDYCLAMLLAEAALPENVEHSERPLLPEAEEALRSAVTQRIESEAYASLSIQQQIDFYVSSWTICGSYDEGRKLAVSDYENTYLYDLFTGMLLFSCEGHEVYFNEDATRAARIDYKFIEDGVYDAVVELYTTSEGKRYFSGQYDRGDHPVAGMWDEDTDCCYILYNDYEENQIVLLDSCDINGDRIEGVTLSDKLEEKFTDGYMYSYFDPYYFSAPSDNSDYTLDGEVTERAIGVEKLLLEKAEKLQEQGYKVHGIKITDDRELALFMVYSEEGFDSYGNKDSIATIVWNLKSPAEEEGWLQILPGECFLDRDNGLIYQAVSSKLYIWTYHPENFSNQKITNTVRSVSNDGKLCMNITSYSYHGMYESINLQVWKTDSTENPLIDTWIAANPKCERFLYYVTPNMDFVFFQAEEGTLELWSPEQGLLCSFDSEKPSETITSLTINKEGTLLAYSGTGVEDNSDSWVEIRSVTDGKLIQSYYFPGSSLVVSHMEFNEEQLLVATEQEMIIYDLNEECPVMELQCGNTGYNQDCCFTSDGLIFSTVRTNKPGELYGIFDAETGERLFGYAMYYQYNPKSGLLVYQPSNSVSSISTSIHVASRNDEGKFEDVYAFSPDGINMNLQGMDDRYFLLNGSTGCAVYETATGDKVLTLNENTYLLVNGVLYDQRLNSSGKILRYPLVDLDELHIMAQRFLTSELGTRELTQEEKERYFIP